MVSSIVRTCATSLLLMTRVIADVLSLCCQSPRCARRPQRIFEPGCDPFPNETSLADVVFRRSKLGKWWSACVADEAYTGSPTSARLKSTARTRYDNAVEIHECDSGSADRCCRDATVGAGAGRLLPRQDNPDCGRFRRRW